MCNNPSCANCFERIPPTQSYLDFLTLSTRNPEGRYFNLWPKPWGTFFGCLSPFFFGSLRQRAAILFFWVATLAWGGVTLGGSRYGGGVSNTGQPCWNSQGCRPTQPCRVIGTAHGQQGPQCFPRRTGSGRAALRREAKEAFEDLLDHCQWEVSP